MTKQCMVFCPMTKVIAIEGKIDIRILLKSYGIQFIYQLV
jgi:hypothetical protein